MSNLREAARQVLRDIHERNVRLSFGPGMHVMTPDKFVFDAVLDALEAAEARGEERMRERCADLCDTEMSRADHRKKHALMDNHKSEICHQEGRWHCANDLGEEIRALEPTP